MMFSAPIMVAETHFSAHGVALTFSACVTALAGVGIAASLAHLKSFCPYGAPTTATRSTQ